MSSRNPFIAALICIWQCILCASSAVLLFLSFPYFNKEYCAWFAFVPWFFAIQGATRGRALFLSYLTGILAWGGIVYWIIHVTLIGAVGLVLYLALYFAVFGLIVATVRVQLSTAKVLFISSVWVLLEFLRSRLLTGFPWALLGYTQSFQLPMIQIADITGVWGVSFLVMAVNVCLHGFLSRLFHPAPEEARPLGQTQEARPGRLYLGPVVFTGALVLTSFVYGQFALSRPAPGMKVDIAVVQGNVTHEDKWQPETQDRIMNTHLRLSTEALKEQPELLVWSEAALPVILEDQPAYFQRTRYFLSQSAAPLLLGSITHRGRTSFYNSALLVAPEGQTLAIYDKMHLVPFGEYVPLRKIFPFLETLAPIGELTRGIEYTVFELPVQGGEAPVKFSTLICFEDLFPSMARMFVSRGARFLVNITNDAWYRFSPATYQHCQAAVFRAIENRVPVVRCANTGVSCFIDEKGNVGPVLRDAAGQELFVEEMAVAPVTVEPKPAARTVYNRYGDIFILFCWLMVFIGSFLYLTDKL